MVILYSSQTLLTRPTYINTQLGFIIVIFVIIIFYIYFFLRSVLVPTVLLLCILDDIIKNDDTLGTFKKVQKIRSVVGVLVRKIINW